MNHVYKALGTQQVLNIDQLFFLDCESDKLLLSYFFLPQIVSITMIDLVYEKAIWEFVAVSWLSVWMDFQIKVG